MVHGPFPCATRSVGGAEDCGSTQFTYLGHRAQIDIPGDGPAFGPEREGTSRFTRAVMPDRTSPSAISAIRIGVIAQVQDIPPPSELPFGTERSRMLRSEEHTSELQSL